MRNTNLLKNDKYIMLSVYADNMSNKERQLMLRSFFTDIDVFSAKGSAKIGLLRKFNNSLGFRDVEFQVNKNGYGYDGLFIDLGDDYRSPYSMLVSNVNWLHRENEVVSFILPIKDIVDNKLGKYSYNTLELIIKFQSFLNKIYHKHIRTEISFESDLKLTLKDKVLSYVYCVMAEGEHVCCEMSLHRKLKLKEKRYILDIMKEYVSFKPAIEQYYCEVCKEHHEKYPYHMEFLSYNTIKKEYEQSIEYGYFLDESILEALEDCK